MPGGGPQQPRHGREAVKMAHGVLPARVSGLTAAFLAQKERQFHLLMRTRADTMSGR